jgi:formylglycine-generating enzyme required for sulfatase activity
LHAIEKSREARPPSAGALAQEFTAALRSADAPAVSYSGFGQQAATPFLPGTNIDEQTVERKHSQAALLPLESLAKTVHVASPRLGVPSISAAPRHTEEGNAAVTATLKRAIPIKYVGIGLAVLFAAALLSLLVMWPRGSENNQNGNRTVNDDSARKDTASNVSSPPSGGTKDAGRPAAPVGMVAVTGGQFLMGSNTGDGDQDSKPAHMVNVKSFYIDVNEVTCEDYKRFVDETNHRVPESWSERTYPAGTARQPVIGVSWEDADAYARWAHKRLPTEQEWELAARGPAQLVYPWGNSWRRECANAANQGQSRSLKSLSDVGTHNCPSPFGANDLIGNAWEWTASDWASYAGGHLQGEPKGGEKVIRGGTWNTPKEAATAIFRVGWVGVGETTGFRCAMDAP